MGQYIDGLIKENNLDALAGVGFGAYSPAAVSGYPSITLPMGIHHEIPIGITFFGGAFSEAQLLGIAYGFEEAIGIHPDPKFLSIP